ncbi:MAG: DUF362 domain-containing protein [Tannerella sp.]|jgi:hypothetical protein|nr:DUF362 domain-containing protein [Tannerella sp.]
METITRRELLKRTAMMAAGSAILLNRPEMVWADTKASTADKSRVVLVRDELLYAHGDTPDAGITGLLLDEAVCRLTDKKTPAEAWASIIKPSDIVGIKTNVWQEFPTPPEVNEALKARVLGVGVKEENLSIDDRGVKQNPVFQKATALINTRPMRTHAWSGVGSLIKNYIMFAEKPSDYHEDSCVVLGSLQELPLVKGKTRLHVLVMFNPQFHHTVQSKASPEHQWHYNGLLVGFDPVAVDSVGLRIIEAKRREFFKEDRPLNPPAKHIAAADTRYHLGTADPAKIELIKLGWDKDIFV